MRNKLPLLAACVFSSIMFTGCAKMEYKFSRGAVNTMEIVRLGEMRRSIEQTALFGPSPSAFQTGAVGGFNRSLARTGVGIYEMVTAPIPPYDPIFTDYLSPQPAYPDNYKPDLMEDSLFATDANLGFSGGDTNPLLPGSRFRIFDTH